MRRVFAALTMLAPIATFGATHTIGADVGRSDAGGVSCDPAFSCPDQGDSWRVSYTITGASGFGGRVSHTHLNGLSVISQGNRDDGFDLPFTGVTLQEIAATYTYPFSPFFTAIAKGGFARWETRRPMSVFFRSDTEEGVTPTLGVSLDVGSRLLRAGLSLDVYPSVGDTSTVLYYGAGVRFVW